MTYKQMKENAREIAVNWQNEESDNPYSCEGMAILGNYFHKLGKRAGLLREFRENGIPC